MPPRTATKALLISARDPRGTAGECQANWGSALAGDGAARLEVPGKVPSAVPAFQRAVTAAPGWAMPAMPRHWGSPGTPAGAEEGQGAVVGWRKG